MLNAAGLSLHLAWSTSLAVNNRIISFNGVKQTKTWIGWKQWPGDSWEIFHEQIIHKLNYLRSVLISSKLIERPREVDTKFDIWNIESANFKVYLRVFLKETLY